jgi:hypothetical protein
MSYPSSLLLQQELRPPSRHVVCLLQVALADRRDSRITCSKGDTRKKSFFLQIEFFRPSPTYVFIDARATLSSFVLCRIGFLAPLVLHCSVSITYYCLRFHIFDVGGWKLELINTEVLLGNVVRTENRGGGSTFFPQCFACSSESVRRFVAARYSQHICSRE